MGWHMVQTASATSVQSFLVNPTGQLAIAEHATHPAAPWADHVLPATHPPHDCMPMVPCAFPASHSAHAVARQIHGNAIGQGLGGDGLDVLAASTEGVGH